MLMSCFTARIPFAMVLSMIWLTTQCVDYVVEQKMESIDVMLCDNSLEIPMSVSGECYAGALVIRVIPGWSQSSGDVNQLPEPLTAIRITAIDVNGNARVMNDFRCLVPLSLHDNDTEPRAVYFEYDATGERLVTPVESVREQYDFYLAYVPDGEPLSGVFQFRVVFEFRDGKTLENISERVMLTNTALI